jgi:hypothetical protein
LAWSIVEAQGFDLLTAQVAVSLHLLQEPPILRVEPVAELGQGAASHPPRASRGRAGLRT